MADSDSENPLDGTEELTEDELREALEETDFTVGELEDHLERRGADYSLGHLQTFRTVEQARDDPRKTALEAIEDQLEQKEEQTRGPDAETPGDADPTTTGPDSRGPDPDSDTADPDPEPESVSASEVEADVTTGTRASDPDAADEAARTGAEGVEPAAGADSITPGGTSDTDAQNALDSGAGDPEGPGQPARTSREVSNVDREAEAAEAEPQSPVGPNRGITTSGEVNLENLNTPPGEADLTSDDIDVGVLPDPYHGAAPETVRIRIPRRMMFAGQFFEDPGVHEVPYREPNDHAMPGMRIKRSLEADTNPVHLDVSDPLHPEYEEDSDPVGEAI